MQRKQINLKIIDELREYICRHPEQRFGQALRNVGIVDTVNLTSHTDNGLEAFRGPYFTNIFYEEPEKTLDRILDFKSREER